MVASSFANLPKLTVLMAVRNAASSVGSALDSLLAQHYPKLELIVWDGLSTDGTSDVLARYSGLITRLINEKDDGPPDAYNRAIAYATGDFVGYLNADDEYEPGMLWAVAEALLRHPQADVVTTGILYRVVSRQGKRRVSGYYAEEGQLVLSIENVLSELPSYMMSRFIRRELCLRVGPYNTDKKRFYISSDREWMSRLALSPCRNIIIPCALYGFTMHAKSISSNPAAYTRIIEEHVMIAQELLQRPELDEAQRRHVRNWRRRQLAAGVWRAFAQLKMGKALEFLRKGRALNGWRFYPYCLWLLYARGIKKVALKFSDGIDRG